MASSLAIEKERDSRRERFETEARDVRTEKRGTFRAAC
jgi:hypothetical protein